MANKQITEDAEILEAMVDNEIVVNMPPKRRYSINLKVQSWEETMEEVLKDHAEAWKELANE